MGSFSKREHVAAFSERLGLTRLLESFSQKRHLIVLAYHRIGDEEQARYDPGLFSATMQEFEWQVSHVKSHLGVLSLDEALDWLEHPNVRHGGAALITFDDGYLDNYKTAFPVLHSQGVEGTFFLATSFVGTNRIPWWDRLAYAIRWTDQQEILLEVPRPIRFDLRTTPREQVLRKMLSLYKSPEVMDNEQFLSAVDAASGVAPPADPERLFLDWDEAAEMVAGGMRIASHTHRHELLAKLSLDNQVEELQRSRALIEERLSVRADVLAYPVGGPTAFSPMTYRALEQTGYRAAFSYYGGVNRPGRTDRFNIRRIPIDSDLRRPLFRLRAATAAIVGQEVI